MGARHPQNPMIINPTADGVTVCFSLLARFGYDFCMTVFAFDR